MSHVFLSYSRSDRGLANRVREDLIAKGVDVWSDRRLGLGGSWLAEISAAIDGAQAVVVLATPDALASPWVLREVEAARRLGRRIVPVLAGDTRFGDLPATLAGINGVDLADGYEESITTLACVFSDPDVPTKVVSALLPELLLMTDDEVVATIVTNVVRPVGLAVLRRAPFDADVLAVAASAQVMVIAGIRPAECAFIAGYAAGRGTRVVWVGEETERLLPLGADVAFCRGEAADLDREIGAAAFLPSQRTAQQRCEVEGCGSGQFTAPDRLSKG